MPKPEWGVKRTCPNCEERFYDLQKEPIVCPECGTTYDVDAHGKVSAAREKRAPAPAKAAKVVEEDLVDEGDVDDDEEEDADEALLGDDEDDEEPASPTLSDEEDEVEAVPFKDASLDDDDDDEDEDEDEEVDIDDDDDDIDLDDVAGKDKP